MPIFILDSDYLIDACPKPTLALGTHRYWFLEIRLSSNASKHFYTFCSQTATFLSSTVQVYFGFLTHTQDLTFIVVKFHCFFTSKCFTLSRTFGILILPSNMFFIPPGLVICRFDRLPSTASSKSLILKE